MRISDWSSDVCSSDLSFSGLKTQVLLAWRDSDQADRTRADIARGFEDAVVDTLAIKCERALDAAGCDVLVVAGGVGANKRLRAKLQAMCERSEEHTSELQSLMRSSYAVFCLKKKT